MLALAPTLESRRTSCGTKTATGDDERMECAPIGAAAVIRVPRKPALLSKVGVFVVGNLLCGFEANYAVPRFARIVKAFCHGAFFGIGAVVAADLAAPNRRASAIALVFGGLTLANVLCVPFGTALASPRPSRSPHGFHRTSR